MRKMAQPIIFFVAANKRHADLYALKNGFSRDRYIYVDSPELMRGYDKNGAVIVGVGPVIDNYHFLAIAEMSTRRGYEWYAEQGIVWPRGDVGEVASLPYGQRPICLSLPFIRFHAQLTEAVEVGHGVAVTADAFNSVTSEFVVLKTPDSDVDHLFDMKSLFKRVDVWPNERCTEGKVWLRIK